MGDQNGQDGKGLDKCVRGNSRLHQKYRKISRIGNKNDAHTVASWVNNLGVSFAHAFTAMVPSVGSSAVIVLRAVNSCHLEIQEKVFNSGKTYLTQRYLEVLHQYSTRIQ